MKTTHLTLLLAAGVFAASAAGTLLAADAPAPCCAPETAAPAAQPTKRACCAEQKPAAPLASKSLYQLDATWTSDASKPVSLVSLRGKPVILAMFFASCEYACPVIVNDIKRLQGQLPDEVRAETQIVLVSFDTARDTPAALSAFRERMSLDQRWTLLRGDEGSVQELAMLLGVKFKQDARGQFAHSNIITALNREGEIAHQLAGLNGDVSEIARVLATLAKPTTVAVQ